MFFRKIKTYTHEFLIVGAPSAERPGRTILAWHKPDKSFIQTKGNLKIGREKPILLGQIRLSQSQIDSGLYLQDMANRIAALDGNCRTSGELLFKRMREMTEEHVDGELVSVYLGTVTTNRDKLLDIPSTSKKLSPGHFCVVCQSPGPSKESAREIASGNHGSFDAWQASTRTSESQLYPAFEDPSTLAGPSSYLSGENEGYASSYPDQHQYYATFNPQLSGTLGNPVPPQPVAEVPRAFERATGPDYQSGLSILWDSAFQEAVVATQDPPYATPEASYQKYTPSYG
ncbi:hypothetical protein C8J56DRAFT_1163894, partial [Mycena floridula]